MSKTQTNIKKFVIKNTRKYGNGVFARTDINKGEIVHLMGGKTLNLSELIPRINSGKDYIDDPLQIGMRTYVELDSVSRTFNHSCEPNLGLRKRGQLFALRDINKGEELTYDYSSTIAPTEWHMNCKCGSKKCRKIISDVLSIPSSQLESYKKSGAIMDYMKTLLERIEKNNGKYVMPRYEVLALEKLKSSTKS